MMAPLDEIQKKIRDNSIVGNKLPEIIKVYEKRLDIQVMKFPRTGDTPLHVAISDGWEHYAAKMVSAAKSGVLKMGNEQGDTPLHLAAKFGNTYICKCIADTDVALVGKRNEFGETPLFSAVSRGKTQAFLFLHYLCKAKECLKYGLYTRKNGDTILHSAISEQHFGLAYFIIEEYPKLVNKLNRDRLSPLHLLATIPSVFPSGLHLSLVHKLIYYCVRVRELGQSKDIIFQVPNPQSQTSWRTHLNRKNFDNKFDFKYPEDKATDTQVDQRKKQDEEEADEKADNGETDQQDEEAANEQVDHKENQPRDKTAIYVEVVGIFILRVIRRIFATILAAVLVCAIFLAFVVYCSILIMIKAVGLLRFPYKLAKYIIGYEEIVRVKRIKERCIWSVEVMNKLIILYNPKHAIATQQKGVQLEPPNNEEEEEDKHIEERCTCSAEADILNSKNAEEHGEIQPQPTNEQDKHMEERDVNKPIILHNSNCAKMVETPILIAARHGILEMVSSILDIKPRAIHDENAEKKNIVMLAVENRHHRLYDHLITNWNFKRAIFVQVDTAGNSLLHLASNLKGEQQFWRIRGAALHMQMEIKWYKFIKKSMPPRFFALYNHERKTAQEIFQETHQHLIEDGRKWLTSTSQSCSLVAALIATVAFATSATVPGGLKQDIGLPTLQHKPFFVVSAASSLIALSSSMLSVVMFLGILTSNFKLKDFRKDLPRKLLLGLISLLISIVSMFISFCAGHYFVLKQEFNHSATLAYGFLCIPFVVIIIFKFPLDFEIVRTTLQKKPHK